MELLKILIDQKDRILYYQRILYEKYHVDMNEQVEESVLRNLKNEFPKEEERRKYSDCVLIEKMTMEVIRFHQNFRKNFPIIISRK